MRGEFKFRNLTRTHVHESSTNLKRIFKILIVCMHEEFKKVKIESNQDLKLEIQTFVRTI